MSKLLHFTALAGSLLFLALPALAQEAHSVSEFELGGGQLVNAEIHSVEAPVDHSRPEGLQLTLNTILLDGTGDGPPTLFLAGGPGESAVSNAQQFLGGFFAELLEAGDVILADQRGTGGSGAVPPCFSNTPMNPGAVSNTRFYADLIETMITDCRATWASQNISTRTWNNSASVADIEIILDTLGVKRINLVGFSYGTSLAQRVLDQLGDRVDRVILVSASETHALKSPRDTDDFFNRLDLALLDAGVTEEPLSAIMRRVHAELNARPVQMEMGEGETAYTLSISGQDLQLLASFMTMDPSSARFLAVLYQQVDAGDYTQLAPMIAQFRASPFPVMPMTLATQAASGAPDEVEAQYLAEAEGSVPGQTMHFPVSDAFTIADFRRVMEVAPDPFHARNRPFRHPTLIVSGSLDGRTTLETQRRVAQDFSNAQQIVVFNGGHNLLAASEGSVARIVEFLATGSTSDESITLPF